MRYENINCAACGKPFTADDDVVVCPVCGAPHHRACWTAAGRCAMTDKHAEGFVWSFPEMPPAQNADEPRQEPADGPHLYNGEKIVPCPRCGASNYQHDTHCMRCGARMDGSDAAGYGQEDDYGGRPRYRPMDYNELRESFDRYGGIDPDAPVDGIPCAEYSDYVGGKKPGKIIRKISTMERYGRRGSWLWSGFLFGPIWYFYRKMKKEGAVLALLMVFFAVLSVFLQLDGPTIRYYKNQKAAYISFMQESRQAAQNNATIDFSRIMTEYREVSEGLLQKMEKEKAEELVSERRTQAIVRSVAEQVNYYILNFALPLLAGILAIPLYRKKAKADIEDARNGSASMEEYRGKLKSMGGTSGVGLLIGLILVAIVGLCSRLLPMIVVWTML